MQIGNRLTSLGLADLLVLLVQHHLVYLLGHRLDVVDNEVVKITVAVLAAHTQHTTNGELVVLVQLKHINVLIHTVCHLPGNCQVIGTTGRRTDNHIATAARTQILLRLGGVEWLEERVLDHTHGLTTLLLLLLHGLSVLALLHLIPIAKAMIRGVANGIADLVLT